MSTPDSRKAWHAIAAIGVGLSIYLAANLGLTIFARSVEAAGLVHPFPDDDGVRYLVPSMFSADRETRIMLTGPSSVREALLYDRFNEAFPGRTTLQGAISLGTFEDVLIALEYVERVYGSEAIPSVMVVGLSQRFVSNLPRNRIFAGRITRFSRRFSVVSYSSGLRLEPKSAVDGIVAEVRFRTEKQMDRYRSAAWGRIAASATPRNADQRPGPVRRFLMNSGLARLLGIEEFLEDGLKTHAAFKAAPYRWHASHWTTTTSEDLLARLTGDRAGFWPKVYQWNPTADSARVLDSFERLHALAERLDIELFFVNMPEHPVAGDLYRPGASAAYSELIRRGAGDTPLLDLRDFLGETDFYDPVHPNLPASRLVTDSVISFMKRASCESRGGKTGALCPHTP